jgi:uroporphyrinogen decarboxylase
MNSRERILTVLEGKIPDCVPVCPDISNMVPARLTGKPFWDIYVYQDPPLWKAYIDAVKYFDIDGGFEVYSFGNLFGDLPESETRIVKRNDDGSFVTQDYYPEMEQWDKFVNVHTKDKPPSALVKPESVGLQPTPESWEPIEGAKEWPSGLELWELIKKEMGDHGVVGMPSGMKTNLIDTPEDVYEYFDNPEKYHKKAEQMLERVKKRIDIIAELDIKPDFLFCGASGSLVLQTPDMFREVVLPVLKETTRLAYKIGIPTHVHSCGPEKKLVKMAAEETDLTVIDPLEIPPMGDCSLAELKKLYGDKIVLKGNLHTTKTMLRGSVEDVVQASKKAIDDAGEGGGFILSTGDQCGRDTPDENIKAMVETARDYGRY